MKNISNLIFIIILNLSLLYFGSNKLLAQDKDTQSVKPSSTNNYYLKTAKLYLELKDYAKAIDALELAIILEPNNTEAQALLKESRELLEVGKKSFEVQEKVSVPKEKITPVSEGKDLLTLLHNADNAIKEKRYDDAAEILELILNADPLNKKALYLKEKIDYIKHIGITEKQKVLFTEEKFKSNESIQEKSIPYQETLRFPAKEQWEDISKRKLPEADKIIEENKTKTEQLRLVPNPSKDQVPKVIEDALNTIISFEFVDTPLKDVVVFLREKTNVNMVIDLDAGNSSITLKLKDEPLRTALNYILPKGHEYVIEGDIIHIYKQKMEMRVYDVRDILINLDDKEPLEFDITAAAAMQMGMRKKEAPKIKDPSERIFDLMELIVTTIEPSSWSSRSSVIGVSGPSAQRRVNIPGQGEGSIVARMGHPGDLVVVNTKYVHKQIEDLLASLRSSQNLQVSIEARFITVTDEFLEEFGSNFSKFFSENATIDTGAANIVGTLSGDPISGLNLSYSLLTNSMVKGFIAAVQQSKDSEILTSPRITLSNTQRGNIAVVQTTNYVQSTSVTEGVVTPVIGTIPEGTTFDVRPVVSADRKYIYLEVTPAVFQIDSIDSFTFTTGSGTASGNGTTNIPPTQTVQLPKVNVSQVSVTVCVPDTGTLMIGGLGAITKENLESGIPILSKIPILKHLFTTDQKNHTKSNLIILLKPTIIIREEQEATFLRLSNKEFKVKTSK